MPASDYMVISRALYSQLEEDAAFLHALEVVGVDNWEGYSTAVGVYSGEIKEEDI